MTAQECWICAPLTGPARATLTSRSGSPPGGRIHQFPMDANRAVSAERAGAQLGKLTRADSVNGGEPRRQVSDSPNGCEPP
jgi:hypothetical protein